MFKLCFSFGWGKGLTTSTESNASFFFFLKFISTQRLFLEVFRGRGGAKREEQMRAIVSVDAILHLVVPVTLTNWLPLCSFSYPSPWTSQVPTSSRLHSGRFCTCSLYSPTPCPSSSPSTHLRRMLPFEELGLTTLRRPRAVGTEDTCLAGRGCRSSQARLRAGLQAPAAAKGTQRSRGAPQQGAGPGRRGKCQAARQGRPQTAPSPGADCQSPGLAPAAWGLCVVGRGLDERPGRENWKAGGRGWSPGGWLCL